METVERVEKMNSCCGMCTDKKNQIFLIHKEIQSGAVAKSYMRKGFLLYEAFATLYEEAVSHI